MEQYFWYSEVYMMQYSIARRLLDMCWLRCVCDVMMITRGTNLCDWKYLKKDVVSRLT